MTVYFIRHGAVANPQKIIYGRLPGFPLSPVGRKEAVQAALQLTGQGIEVIYASPLWRTKQTAEIVNEKLKVPLFYDDLLLEFDSGRYEGIGDEEYKRRELWREGGETLAAAGDRVLHFLQKIKKEGRYQTLAVVSHEAPVVMALLNLAGKTEDAYGSIKFPTGGILKLEYWEGLGRKSKAHQVLLSRGVV